MAFNHQKSPRGFKSHSAKSAPFVAKPMDNKSVTVAYRRWSKFYDFSFGFFVKSVRHRLIAEINKKCHGTLLDVGVGTGSSLELYKRDLAVTGIDYSNDMLDLAKRKVFEKKLSHVKSLEHMDASCMRFADNSFDTVVCMHVMSVVPDPVQVFKEVERVCKPGGRIYIMNHFLREAKGPRFYLEKIMAPASRLLGWHPDFSKDTLLSAATRLQLQGTEEVGFCKLFTIMCFTKN